jgi:hypothetical protein
MVKPGRHSRSTLIGAMVRAVMLVRVPMIVINMLDPGAAHMMVMALLRRADRVWVADYPGAVFA